MRDREALEERRRAARSRLDMAKYIDSPEAYRKECDEARSQIRFLEGELAELDPFSPHGSGPVPIEPREV